MGPHNHAVSHLTFYHFFLCPMSHFIRNLLRHVPFYMLYRNVYYNPYSPWARFVREMCSGSLSRK